MAVRSQSIFNQSCQSNVAVKKAFCIILISQKGLFALSERLTGNVVVGGHSDNIYLFMV